MSVELPDPSSFRWSSSASEAVRVPSIGGPMLAFDAHTRINRDIYQAHMSALREAAARGWDYLPEPKAVTHETDSSRNVYRVTWH